MNARGHHRILNSLENANELLEVVVRGGILRPSLREMLGRVILDRTPSVVFEYPSALSIGAVGDHHRDAPSRRGDVEDPFEPAVGPDPPHSEDEIARLAYPHISEIVHVHHAGNSSGIVDGAALVAIGSEAAGERHGLTPRARIVSAAVSGADPTIMLTGPAPACRKALDKAGLTVADIDLLEINEAFAAVAMRLMQDLDFPHDRTNVNGGSIAMGHPLGATGAMILGTLIDELERRDLRYGLATLCVGGGMGIATIVERI